MKREIVYGLIGLVLFLVVGALLGLFTGMNIGGNYFPTFAFAGYVGYEATGMIGLVLGGLVGAVVGFFLGQNFAKRPSR